MLQGGMRVWELGYSRIGAQRHHGASYAVPSANISGHSSAPRIGLEYRKPRRYGPAFTPGACKIALVCQFECPAGGGVLALFDYQLHAAASGMGASAASGTKHSETAIGSPLA